MGTRAGVHVWCRVQVVIQVVASSHELSALNEVNWMSGVVMQFVMQTLYAPKSSKTHQFSGETTGNHSNLLRHRNQRIQGHHYHLACTHPPSISLHLTMGHSRQVRHIFSKHRGTFQLVGSTGGETSPSLALVKFVVHPVVSEAKQAGLGRAKRGNFGFKSSGSALWFGKWIYIYIYICSSQLNANMQYWLYLNENMNVMYVCMLALHYVAGVWMQELCIQFVCIYVKTCCYHLIHVDLQD